MTVFFTREALAANCCCHARDGVDVQSGSTLSSIWVVPRTGRAFSFHRSEFTNSSTAPLSIERNSRLHRHYSGDAHRHCRPFFPRFGAMCFKREAKSFAVWRRCQGIKYNFRAFRAFRSTSNNCTFQSVCVRFHPETSRTRFDRNLVAHNVMRHLRPIINRIGLRDVIRAFRRTLCPPYGVPRMDQPSSKCLPLHWAAVCPSVHCSGRKTYV